MGEPGVSVTLATAQLATPGGHSPRYRTPPSAPLLFPARPQAPDGVSMCQAPISVRRPVIRKLTAPEESERGRAHRAGRPRLPGTSCPRGAAEAHDQERLSRSRSTAEHSGPPRGKSLLIVRGGADTIARPRSRSPGATGTRTVDQAECRPSLPNRCESRCHTEISDAHTLQTVGTDQRTDCTTCAEPVAALHTASKNNEDQCPGFAG